MGLKTMNRSIDVGLVLHLPLSEGAGAKVWDRSAYGNHGDVTFGGGGAAAFWANTVDGAPVGTFDGLADYVNMGDILNFGAADSFSLSVRFTPTSVGRKFIICKGTLDGAPVAGNEGYDLGTYNGRILSKLHDIDESIWIGLDGPTRVTGILYHAVLVIDRITNKARFYVNGIQSGIEQDISTFGSFSNNDTLKIGTYSRTVTYNPFEGLIDEVRIYNRALSSQEVRTLSSMRRRI